MLSSNGRARNANAGIRVRWRPRTRRAESSGSAKIRRGAQEIRGGGTADSRENEILRPASQSRPTRPGTERLMASDSRTPEGVSPGCTVNGEVHICVGGRSPEQSLTNESRAVVSDSLGAVRAELKTPTRVRGEGLNRRSQRSQRKTWFKH